MRRLNTCTKRQRRLSAARIEEVSSKYTTILEKGKAELPERPPRKNKRGRIPKNEVKKLLDAFVSCKDEIRRFAKRLEALFSNNQTEREIRMVKVRQKNPGTYRNAEYAQAYCRISSCLQSMSPQGCSSISAIQKVLNGNATAMFGQSKLNHINQHSNNSPFHIEGGCAVPTRIKCKRNASSIVCCPIGRQNFCLFQYRMSCSFLFVRRISVFA